MAQKSKERWLGSTSRRDTWSSGGFWDPEPILRLSRHFWAKFFHLREVGMQFASLESWNVIARSRPPMNIASTRYMLLLHHVARKLD
jgi:hypothetical protein